MKKMLQARLIGYAYDLDEQNDRTKILDSTDNYVIQQVSDRFVENGLCRKLGRAG